jgi:hypothetical protein
VDPKEAAHIPIGSEPSLAGKNVWLLALAIADTDRLISSDLDVAAPAPKQVKCGLKRVRLAGDGAA